tara:strand:+ start:4040 stop:7084 length:3045 start_codon:yes stop_codon:yes gene_type:complete
MISTDSNAPTATELEEAIAQLGRMYGITSSSEFMAKLLGFAATTQQVEADMLNGKSTIKANPSADIVKKASTDAEDPINFLTSGILGLTDGGLFISEFNNRVSSFMTKAQGTAVATAIAGSKTTGNNRLFTVTADKSAYNPITAPHVCKDISITDLISPESTLNSHTADPSKELPSLAIVQFHSAALNFANRYTGAVSIFMSALPSIEISQCVPYLDVQLITNTPVLDDDIIGQGISLFRFLDGNSKVDKNIADFLSGKPVKKESASLLATQDDESEKTLAGMEVFTAPQTLVNGNEPYQDIGPPISTTAGTIIPNRGTSVIDKFRPFMTLQSFNIKVLPSVGTLSTKTAEMSFILHDRSRLHEITQLVTPGGLGDIEILVEFGWSHPNKESPYGMLLNSMRSKEKFGVMNSSYSFDPNGEVKVNLKLYSKGSRETAYKLITDDDAGNALDHIQECVKTINSVRKKLKSLGFKSLSDIVSGGEVLGKVNSVSSMLSMSDEDIKKLMEIQKKIHKASKADGDAMSELSDALLSAVNGSKGSGSSTANGGLKSYRARIEKISREKIKRCTDGNDPFLKKNSEQKIDPDDSPAKYASFAKIACNFIGSPLAATHNFDEVQMIFYPMNEFASFARDDDVGSFPIELKYFKSAILKKMKSSKTFTIGQFIGFMNREFFSNTAAHAYGFGSIYSRDEKTGKATLIKHKNEKKDAAFKLTLPSVKEGVLKKAYKNPNAEYRFKKPSISIYIECVPATKDPAKTICRVHFFDKSATAYPGFAEMWNSIKNDSFGLINKEIMGSSSTKDKTNTDPQRDSDSQYAELFSKQLEVLEALNIVEMVESKPSVSTNEEINTNLQKKYFRIKGGPNGLRYMFTKYMPTIKFGTEYSAILNASLATNSNPQMQVIHMKRQKNRSSEAPVNDHDDGLPLRVFPVKLSMDSFGCPMLNFGQQFFVDFQTGTTIDDVYLVSSVSHKLSPGEFKTSFELVPLNKSGQFNSLVENLTKGIQASSDLSTKLGKQF